MAAAAGAAYASSVRGKLIFGIGMWLAACGETSRDATVDASAGGGASGSGGTAGISIGGAFIGGAGGVLSGGAGGVLSGGAGGVLTGGVGNSAGNAGSGGGQGGYHPCTTSADCAPDEYCAWGGGSGFCGPSVACKPRPTSCPGECIDLCPCNGEWCNICISRMFGFDAIQLNSICGSDGGGPNTMDAGLGDPCGFYSGVCVPPLKCCYPCSVAGCSATCIEPDANGMCPTLTAK